MQLTHRRLQRRRILQICLILLALALVLGGALFAVKQWDNRRDPYTVDSERAEEWSYPTEELPTIWYNGQEYLLRDTVETLLLLGLDSYEMPDEEHTSYNNNLRSDFLMLLVFDREAGTCQSLHIDRDTMAEIHMLGIDGLSIGTTWAQLALAHTYGNGGGISCKNTVRAVRGFLYDTPIDHYLSITMEALEILNDEVGGVTVTIEDDLRSVDSAFVQGTTVTLNGEQALKFVRARSGLENSTNRKRMERQRQYMDALYERLSSNISTDETFAARVLSKISQNLVSDCQAAELLDLLTAVSSYEFVGIGTIEGESVLGKNNLMEFSPDEEKLQQLIIDLFYEPVTGS